MHAFNLGSTYFGLFHLVIADELSIASTGVHQGLGVSGLPDLPFIQNQDVITELQILASISENNCGNKIYSVVRPVQNYNHMYVHIYVI